MNYFIKNIHINHLLHLQNFDIKIEDKNTPHLIITGKNGSGKTILLNAIASFLERIKDDTRMEFLNYKVYLDNYTKRLDEELRRESDENILGPIKRSIEHYRKRVDGVYGKVELDFVDAPALMIEKYQKGEFVIAFYQAARKPEMIEPKNPTKPTYEIKGAVKQTATNQFLNFLSDLKIQEALARNENEIKDADEINLWFTDFENLLKQIYQDDSLKLVFNYRDYSFRINTEGKNFKFTELSDGFAAILDIVADLILKMQVPGNVTRAYKKAGVVLIDEVETHLHLELQKIVMPILTKIFPNIQFIITTHSPFVLNSLDNAVAFDLENREVINELTQYSYEALAEGYFGVSSMSSYMQMQLDKLEDILKKDVLSDLDKSELKYLITDLEKVPESVSPNLVGAFTDIKNRFLIIPSRR
ncbi:AAA family ATPase [uncultured Bacteroides sp.]|uniref:AAA family ATPase n=1 Tax=uncultured Bacteroides sp. TaxID=162156 RepID=UPI00262AD857|nr:AAA family ATPase [uncultured Bacteroides sp.]